MLSRRKFLSTALALTGLAMLPSCRSPVDTGSPVLSFRQGDASCGGGPDDAHVQVGPGSIRFSGHMTMPNPCHRLDAMLEITRPSELIVHISAIAPKDPNSMCIQCIGSASYQGEITGMRAGQYTVSIRHRGLEIKRAVVTVS